jgi:hypothetical protein
MEILLGFNGNTLGTNKKKKSHPFPAQNSKEKN